jgi:hypothetical protein
LGFFRIGVLEHLRQHGGNHLSGHAIPVFEPAALLGLLIAACREFPPIIVQFFLRLTTDLERDGLVKCEHRPPLSTVKACPSSSKATTMTVPAGLPWTSCPASPYRVMLTIREFLKIEV